MNLLRKHWKYIPVLSLAVLLSGCLGDDDSTPAAATLSGIAATGAPIVGGLVTVKCAAGTATDPQTENDGKWEVPVAGLTLPCAVEVNGGTIGVGGPANATPYYSTAISAGTVNITPLTSMIVAEMASNTDLATWFGALSSGVFANINSNALQNAQTAVENAIAGLRTGLGSLNPFTSTFTAASGNQMDDILEALGASGATYAQIVTALVNNASLPGGFSFTYLPPASGGSGGTGGGATSCSAGQTLLTYDGTSVSPMTDGSGYCVTVSTTSLTINGVTMTDPVGTPFGKFYDATNDLFYEVVYLNNALHEINVIFDRDGDGVYDQQQSINDTSADIFKGQLTVASQGNSGGSGGTSGGQTGTLTVGVSISGAPATTFGVAMPGIQIPASQIEFCDAISNDSTFTSIGASGGGSLTINSCTFSGNVGTLSATLSITSPIAMTLPYTVTYTYQ